MYLEHFGLRQAPFRITPHTEFFFSGGKRGATLAALIYAVTHDEGIVKVSGEVGSGKTMLCRMLLEQLPENVETIYLANPMLSRDEVLYAVAEELGMQLPDGRSHLLLRALQERLLETYAAGRQVVVLIDEAHAMPPEALEEIRLLSNLESNRHKLLQIVLFGQPELDSRLLQTSMRQLNDRITHSFRLEPLHRSDVSVYLMFRLRAAGYRGPDLFTRGAIELISRTSGGLSRRINILADKALLAAFSEGVHQVGRRQMRAAMRDVGFGRLDRRPGVAWQWAGAVGGVCAIAALAYLIGSQRGDSLRVGWQGAEVQPPAAAESPVAASSLAAAASPLTTSGEPLVVAPTPASEAPAPVADAATGGRGLPGAPQSPTLDGLVTASEAWLARTPDSHYFIQLLVADAGSEKEVLDFIGKSSSVLDPAQLRVYRSRLSGRDRLGVIYGDYASREQATAALARLGEVSPASKPYVRAVGRLR